MSPSLLSLLALGLSSVSALQVSTPGQHAKLVFLRHGQSTWNQLNLFTGWVDVPLSDLGVEEATAGGQELKKAGLKFDVAYTSLLQRAQETCRIGLTESEQTDVTVIKDWRLNERHYGALQGKDKKETVAEFGEAQVKVWRRSYDVPPPPVVAGSKYDAKVDPLYAGIDASTLPECECLKDTVERCLPLWDEQIAPALQRGETVLVAAHGNSIRGLLKFLDGISEDEITGVEIPSRSRSCTTSTRSCGPSRRRAASRRCAVPSLATPRRWPRPRPRWRPRRRWPSRRRLPCSTPSSTSCWQRRRPSSSTTPAWRRSSRTTEQPRGRVSRAPPGADA